MLEQAREQAEAAGRHADECLFRILLGADANVPELEKLIARARRARKAKARR